MKKKKGVIVTRPANQARHLLALIEEIGAQPVPFPLLRVDTLPFDQNARQIVMNLDSYDHVIFVSTNAVEIGLPWIESYWPQFPLGLTWLAVGKATAGKLAEHGIASISPTRESSEGLLSLAELTQVQDSKVLIVRGRGGREMLANQLQERGAGVTYLEVYQRQREQRSSSELAQLRQRFDIKALMITSEAGLIYFDELVDDESFRAMIKLVIPSERLEQTARNLGYTHCIRSSGADDASMLAACAEFVADQ